MGSFRDWAVNLAENLAQDMDYWRWRNQYLEQTIDNLDWKIGWVEEDEPGLVERLRRLDGRLARLEGHLWPDEPPEGGSDGVWLGGPDEKGGSGGSGADSAAAR